MPTRHELITKAASFPVGHPERKAILDSLSKKARGPLLLWTGQGMETREFGVAEQRLHGDAEDIARQILELPARVEALVKDYLRGMKQQVGFDPRYWETGAGIEIENGVLSSYSLWTVDMEGWPEGEAFDTWFDKLDTKHHIERGHD
jgi:hypothetical protein